MKNTHDELLIAYKKESNPKVKERMIAVLNVVKEKFPIVLIMKTSHKSYNTIKNWVMRFRKSGIAGLYDKPKSGRPPKLENHKITEFIEKTKDFIFPKKIAHDIKKQTGVKYTPATIRYHLRGMNYTRKVPDTAHLRKASPKEISKWQHDLPRWISCVKRDSFELFIQDEAIVLHDPKPRRGPWSKKGKRILLSYHGDHARRVIYGAISDEHQYFWSAKKFDGTTFIQYVEKLLERIPKVALIMDAASQHRTKAFEKFVEKNKHRLRVKYLPTGCPEFSAIEECWNDGRGQPFMFEHYEDIDGCAKALVKYLNNAVFIQDIEAYLYKKPVAKTF